MYENFEQWIEALDGESLAVYMKRIKQFFFEELAAQKADNVLVITHAGVIRVLMAIVKEIPLEKAFTTSLPYASYIVYDTEKEIFKTAVL